MNDKINQLCEDLEKLVTIAYEEGVTIPEAEKLAAKCLGAQMTVANQLKIVDLDARMKKHGVKAVRSAVYLAEVQGHEKKPSEGYLENIVNGSKEVEAAEKDYAIADTNKEFLSNYFGIFKDAHIYFRGIAKGKYE